MDAGNAELSNAQVVGIAGAASSAIAGAIVVAGRSRERDDASVRAKEAAHAAEETATKAKDRARAAAERAGDRGRRLAVLGEEHARDAAHRLDGARKWGRGKVEAAASHVPSGVDGDGLKEAGAAVAGRASAMGKRSRDAAERGAKKGQDVTERAKERAQRAGEKASEQARRAAEQAQQAGEQTASTAQAVAAQATAAAAAGVERAREAGTALADTAREAGTVLADTARERMPHLTHKVTDEVVPTLRDVALQAAAAAVETWQAARERASEVAESAQTDLAPQAAHAVAVGTGRAKEASTRAKDASAAVAEKAAERADEARERARDASRRAAEATIDTTKDTGALLFWAGAAAGLVFYALLSAERREQLTRTAQSITNQVQDLIKDFQGYDDEF